jgi:hypothetical protein
VNKQELIGWGLGSLAVAIGYVQWGWQGVVLAITLVVFWLLLQFSRAVRSLREAAGAPVGSVSSAVMLHTRLKAGMNLPAIMRLAGSLGRKVVDDPETFEWSDEGGATVRAEMKAGRLARWELLRNGESNPTEAGSTPQA